jgi:hypothetical protein
MRTLTRRHSKHETAAISMTDLQMNFLSTEGVYGLGVSMSAFPTGAPEATEQISLKLTDSNRTGSRYPIFVGIS